MISLTNDNRKVGTSFEQALCHKLSGYGFWAHNLAQNKQGQPFDVIAARNGKTYPIDCKVCEKDIFRLERVEENQYSAMTLWRQTGNGNGWFALRLTNGEVWFLSLEDIERAALTRKSLYWSEIKQFGISLEEWVRLCE
nr:MAG TPA: hypothetical protein [Caudoviricetes sp.]